MPTISLGGLASGIDTGSLIDGLMGVARLPVDQLDTNKTKIDSAATTISSLSTKLSTLKNAALALSTSVGFSSFSSSSSDAAVVATTTGAANLGSYNVSVTALAKAQKTRTNTFESGVFPSLLWNLPNAYFGRSTYRLLPAEAQHCQR